MRNSGKVKPDFAAWMKHRLSAICTFCTVEYPFWLTNLVVSLYCDKVNDAWFCVGTSESTGLCV